MPRSDNTENETTRLLDRAAAGDRDARNELFRLARAPLLDQVAPRLRGALATRVDRSDIVQETMAVADARLGDYLRAREVPFFIWLRELAMERVVDAYRFHLGAAKRSVTREQPQRPLFDDASMTALAGQLADRGSSPSRQLQRRELRQKVRDALASLAEIDRDVLSLRHLEHLSMREIAAVLQSTENAVKVRHLRALQRLRERLGEGFREEFA